MFNKSYMFRTNDNHNFCVPLDTKISELQKYVSTILLTGEKEATYDMKWGDLDILDPHEIIKYKITDNQNGMPLFKIYNEFVDIDYKTPEINYNTNTINFQKAGLDINFIRTVKLSKNIANDKKYPPPLGEITLFQSNSESNLALNQFDAMIVNFSRSRPSRTGKKLAVKLYCNNINVISGDNKDKERKIIDKVKQNYVYSPSQKWIEGIMHHAQKEHHYLETMGSQFLSPQIHYDVSMNSHLKQENIRNVLTLEVFTLYNKNFICYNSNYRKFMGINDIIDNFNMGDELIFYEQCFTKKNDYFNMTLGDLGIGIHDIIKVTKNRVIGEFFLKSVDGKTLTFLLEENMSVKKLKYLVQMRLGPHPLEQRLIASGRQLEVGNLSDYGVDRLHTIHLLFRLESGDSRQYNTSNACKNGYIVQRIWIDDYDVEEWNTQTFETYKINIINNIQHNKIIPIPQECINNKEWMELYSKEQNLTNKAKNKIRCLKCALFKIASKNVFPLEIFDVISQLMMHL